MFRPLFSPDFFGNFMISTGEHHEPHEQHPESLDEVARCQDALIDAGTFMHSRGWLPATSGNLSIRLTDGRIAITASGAHKGRLTRADILLLDDAGQPLEPKTPSAETLLHLQIYRQVPEAGAVLHPHTVNATLISKLYNDHIDFKDYELLKALSGISTHETSVRVPIFNNDQNIPRLAAQIDGYLRQQYRLWGYLIRSHGFYTWGASIHDALRHIEALEFLFECEMRLLSVIHR